MRPSGKDPAQVMLLLAQSPRQTCVQSRQVFCGQNSRLYEVTYIPQLPFLTRRVLGGLCAI